MINVNLILILLNFFFWIINAETVTIGTQVWMTKNLDVSTFRNGEPIPQAKTDEEWNKANNDRKPAWRYYGDDATNGTKYGKLYNWFAVKDSRGLAPVGYHIPTDDEWKTLTNFLGGTTIKGASSYTKWNKPNDFTALMGGYLYETGGFYEVSKSSFWWSSEEVGGRPNFAFIFFISNAENFVSHGWSVGGSGYYVRCLRN